MLVPILSLVAVMLLGVIFELRSWWVTRRDRKQTENLHTWRRDQQSKWRVKYPSVQFNDPWDDIPVFAQKVEK